MENPVTYWDSFDFSYQMGAQKHRVYLLDKLKELGVKSLLDVGCGTGPIYDLIINAEEGKWDNITKYKGTDYSLGMIEVCKREMPHGNFEVEDARNLLEKDNSWECVLLMHSLDHIDDYKTAIAEAVRVSKKYIVIILWRSFIAEDNGDRLIDRNTFGIQEGDKPWQDTWMHEYSEKALLDEFTKHNLFIKHEVSGEEINLPHTTNYMYILEKEQNEQA